jgi:hypothetical protein
MVGNVFRNEKGGVGWPSREDITVGSHLFGLEREQRRGKREKAFDTIASHGMDDFLDSYRGGPTTVRRIRAHIQHNVSQSLPGS